MEQGERLTELTKAIYRALVPASGPCRSVQGELVRASTNLIEWVLRNGEGDDFYSDDFERVEDTMIGELACFVLGILIANRNQALDDDDVAYFVDFRKGLEPYRARGRRAFELDDRRSELTGSEREELEALERDRRDPWEEFDARAERCIVDWCIANPALIDVDDHPIEECGVRDLSAILQRFA